MPTATRSTLPAGVRVHRATDADVVLARDRHKPDRMAAWLRFTDHAGVEHVVVLNVRDCVRLMNSMATLIAADGSQVRTWWKTLMAKESRDD